MRYPATGGYDGKPCICTRASVRPRATASGAGARRVRSWLDNGLDELLGKTREHLGMRRDA